MHSLYNAECICVKRYSKEFSCVSQSGIKAFIHSKGVSSVCLQKIVNSYLEHTVDAVNYLKSSLARLELAIYHTVSKYCVMNFCL